MIRGVTIEQLADATRRKPAELRFVLDDELRAGRITRDEDGRFTIVTEAFGRATLRAIAAVSPPEISDSMSRRATSTRKRSPVDDASGTRWEPANHARTSERDSQHVASARRVSEARRTREGAK